jgi:hypothetical protein
MDRPLIMLVLVAVLVACEAPAQPPPAALAPTVPAATTRMPVTPYLTAAPPSAPSSTPTLSTPAQPTTGTASTAYPLPSDATALPVVLQTAIWHGIRLQYDANRYHFSETVPYAADPRPRATAILSYTVNPCPPNTADCPSFAASLALYSRDGRDFWSWLAQQTKESSYSLAGDFTDDAIAGQPAAFWPSPGLGGTTIAVSIGEDALVILGVESDVVASMIQMEQPNALPLAAGQIAMTTLERRWALWSDATGGVRVEERPLLYGGAFVSILDIEPQAVQLRTPEGVTGWIHAAASQALSTQLAISGEYAQIIHASRAQIAQGHAVPVRAAPRSTASQRGDLLTPGQEVGAVSVHGDWLQIYAGTEPGWIRWYYDGTQYVNVVNQ